MHKGKAGPPVLERGLTAGGWDSQIPGAARAAGPGTGSEEGRSSTACPWGQGLLSLWSLPGDLWHFTKSTGSSSSPAAPGTGCPGGGNCPSHGGRCQRGHGSPCCHGGYIFSLLLCAPKSKRKMLIFTLGCLSLGWRQHCPFSPAHSPAPTGQAQSCCVHIPTLYGLQPMSFLVLLSPASDPEW